jgi:hypothetical protein
LGTPGRTNDPINEFLKSKNLIDFSDMINDAAYYISKNKFKNKFKYIIIDEFQDTDKEQYAIFDRLFGNDKILFYIGDPKQSIYAFRKADIFTYFNAKKSVENLHFMDTNFRSTEAYINAMNYFFLPIPDFDTFYFDRKKYRIYKTFHCTEHRKDNKNGRLDFILDSEYKKIIESSMIHGLTSYINSNLVISFLDYKGCVQTLLLNFVENSKENTRDITIITGYYLELKFFYQRHPFLGVNNRIFLQNYVKPFVNFNEKTKNKYKYLLHV